MAADGKPLTGCANPWPDYDRVPRGPAAILAALHISEPRYDLLRRLTDLEWTEALEFSDRWQLTLPLRRVARERLPEWLRERTDANAARNLQRLARLEQIY